MRIVTAGLCCRRGARVREFLEPTLVFSRAIIPSCNLPRERAPFRPNDDVRRFNTPGKGAHFHFLVSP
jgi:hypothetical protein